MKNKKELEKKMEELKQIDFLEKDYIAQVTHEFFIKGVIQGMKYSLGEIDDIYEDKWNKGK